MTSYHAINHLATSIVAELKNEATPFAICGLQIKQNSVWKGCAATTPGCHVPAWSCSSVFQSQPALHNEFVSSSWHKAAVWDSAQLSALPQVRASRVRLIRLCLVEI